MASSPRPIRVLLVDDEVDFRTTLGKLLTRRGMQVESAGDGEQALARLEGGEYDVVVLDLRMPALDGLQTLRRIRELHPATRVIILTGHGSAAAGLEAIRQQAFDFLLKPVRTEQLVDRIVAAARADQPVG